MSVARAQWPVAKNERLFFARIFGVNDRAVDQAPLVLAQVAELPVGSPVSYRVRRGANIFVDSLPVIRFEVSDYLAIYVSYFLVAACFLSAGLWIIRLPQAPTAASNACFALCLAVATTLFTGGDVYGPYWFTPLYFIAHSVTPAALLHLAASYPEPIGAGSIWRRFLLVALYTFSLAVGAALVAGFDEPSIFLPLLYTLYLLLANALLLYIARLAVAYWSITDPPRRGAIRFALAGVVASGTLAGVIFVVYPALDQPVSPLALVLPMAFLPWPTAVAVSGVRDPTRRVVSIRSRLSLLLLGTVETTFLVGVGMFWLNDSWQRLLDDLTLNQRQQSRLERLLSAGDAAARPELSAVAERAQTVDEHTLAAAATDALRAGDRGAVLRIAGNLLERYRAGAEQLEQRKVWLVRISSALVVVLVFVGLVQATGFMLVVRRWLIGPMDQLSKATAVIATGDLGHRIGAVQTDEFAALANAIDRMAGSLADIQRKIHREREARRNAAGAARDLERRRLARELHDGALQNLTAVKYGLEGELKSRGATDLRHLLDGATRCILELRAIVDDLRAPDLADQDLSEAIAAHARALAQGQPIDLELDLREEAEVAPWAGQDVYRVAQEAMANAVRHGRPGRLQVRLVQRGSTAVLEVRDDGHGFDPEAVQLGNGLVGMRERAAALGADLQIESAPGKGTLVRLEVPKTGEARGIG
jgi:signal transduction histidine kinase